MSGEFVSALRDVGIVLPEAVLADTAMVRKVNMATEDDRDGRTLRSGGTPVARMDSPQATCFISGPSIVLFMAAPERIEAFYGGVEALVGGMRDGSLWEDMAAAAMALDAYDVARCEEKIDMYSIREVAAAAFVYPRDSQDVGLLVRRWAFEMLVGGQRDEVGDAACVARDFVRALVSEDLAFTGEEEGIWTDTEKWDTEASYLEAGRRLATVMVAGLQEEPVGFWWPRRTGFTAAWVRAGREMPAHSRILLLAVARMFAEHSISGHPLQEEMFERGADALAAMADPDDGGGFQGSPVGQLLLDVAMQVVSAEDVDTLSRSVLSDIMAAWDTETGMALVRLVSCWFVYDGIGGPYPLHPFPSLPDPGSLLNSHGHSTVAEDIVMFWPAWIHAEASEQ
jgi:hypothetical protein